MCARRHLALRRAGPPPFLFLPPSVNGECVDRFKGDVPKDAIQRNLGNVAATGDSISGTFSKIGYRRVCDSRSQVLVGGECVGRN